MEWDADGTRHTLKQQSVEWLYWYFADHTKMGEGSLVELSERYALTIPGIDLGRPWAGRPLMKVLDSSILAEYGNCDRLMEILEHEPIADLPAVLSIVDTAGLRFPVRQHDRLVL